MPEHMPEMTPAQQRLLNLINDLPVADGKIPINDVKDADGNVTLKGAHGVANKTEAEIAGMLKAQSISAKLSEVASLSGNEGYNLDGAIRSVARIATSYDAAQTLNDIPKDYREAGKTLQDYKNDTLDMSDTAKQIVIKAIAYANSKDKGEQAQLAGEIVQTAKLPNVLTVEPVVTEEIIQAARAKHYEITPEGNLFNQSTVRLGNVPGRESGTLHQLQAAADSVSNDPVQKQAAIAKLVENLKDTPVLAGDKVGIFDIGVGDGQAAAKAIEAVRKVSPGAHIDYTGIEMLAQQPGVQPAIKAAAGGNDTINLIGHTVFNDPNNPVDLSAYDGKNNLVMASHLYNTKDLGSFTQKTDALMTDNGVTFLLHEMDKDSAIYKFRKAHEDKLRPGTGDKVSQIENFLTKEGRDFATFKVKTTDTITPLTDKEMAVLKNMETGVFTKDYSQDFAEGPERDSFQQKQKLLEYFTRAPMEAFDKNERAALLDDFQQMLVKSGGELERYSEVQAVLGKNRSQEVSDAVHKAADATNAYFAEQEKAPKQPQQPQQQQAAASWTDRATQSAMQKSVGGSLSM